MKLCRVFVFVIASLSGSATANKQSSSGRRVPRGHVCHERHEQHHLEGWVKRGTVSRRATVPVRIGLRQEENFERAEKVLMEISDPKSPKFGKYLSPREVVDLFTPKQESIDEVVSWLRGEGVDGRRLGMSYNKQWIGFDAPVDEIERLLHTQYHIYEHVESGVLSIACSEYHVPHNISHLIDYITPGIKLATSHRDVKIAKRAIRIEDERQSRRLMIERRNAKRNDNVASATDAPQLNVPQIEDKWFKPSGWCSGDVTPQCIRAQYQIPVGSKSTPGNELGIFQSLGQHYNQHDLDTYFRNIAPWVPKGTFPSLRSINGALGPTNDVSKAGFEADLDFEVAIPLVWPQKTVLFQVDDEWYQQEQTRSDSKYPGFFNTFFDALDASYCHLTAYNLTGNCRTSSCRDPEYPNPNVPPLNLSSSTPLLSPDAFIILNAYHGPLMCGAHPPTKVISISYSGTEHTWPANYMRRQCLEIMKLTLQGITVVESSGDVGVGGGRYNSQVGCLGANRTVYAPRVMSNCPYVLSVGATMLVDKDDGTASWREVAAEGVSSGGGFSNIFPRPWWQNKAVTEFLNSNPQIKEKGYILKGEEGFSNSSVPEGKVFNLAGRAYPDVAAIGENFKVVWKGYPNRMDGTSVAVPIWASILTLINEERLAVGKGPVGFVHPVLYAHPEVFTDITEGSNPGCGSEGFPATKGWDPVTGLGTPIFPKLLELFMSLP